MRTLSLFGLALALAGAASGQPADPASEPDPVYHVELIIFAYNAGDRGEEDFRHGLEQLVSGPEPRLLRMPAIELENLFAPFPGAAAPPPVTGESGPDVDPDSSEDPGTLEDPGASDATDQTGNPGVAAIGQSAPGDQLELIELESRPVVARRGGNDGLPGQFRVLTRSELELGDARSRLARLGAYSVLGHVGWAQAGVDTDRSVQLDLKWLGITNPRGTIEVSLRRFLRVALELEYFDGSGTLWTPSETPGLGPLEYAPSYRLTTERTAIRSDELHYIDHPLFGILVRFTRAPEVDEANTAVTGQRPAG
jgi:hypothetical protein